MFQKNTMAKFFLPRNFHVRLTYGKTASPIYFKVKSDTVKCLSCEEIYFIVPILVWDIVSNIFYTALTRKIRW